VFIDHTSTTNTSINYYHHQIDGDSYAVYNNHKTKSNVITIINYHCYMNIIAYTTKLNSNVIIIMNDICITYHNQQTYLQIMMSLRVAEIDIQTFEIAIQ